MSDIPSNKPGGIRLSTSAFVIICVALVATTGFISRRPACPNCPSNENVIAAEENSLNGPWGELIIQPVNLEKAIEYVTMETKIEPITRWHFGAMSETQIAAILQQSGLSSSESDTLIKSKISESSDTVLTPNEALLLRITPAQRIALYTALARIPGNPLMLTPYRLSPTVLDTLSQQGFPSDFVQSNQALSYEINGIRYLSDVGVLLSKLKTDEERNHYLQTITSVKSVIANLKIKPDTDIEKVIGYWCHQPGVRSRDVRPLLESIKQSKQGGEISIMCLLPPFARERLYTFPFPEKPGDVRMDCHWTALNFANVVPDDRLQDLAFSSKIIAEKYYQIGNADRMGDLIFLTDSAGGIIHSAVHIAGDLVFSKNGVNYAQPWVLMHRKDMLDLYTGAEKPQILIYRTKES